MKKLNRRGTAAVIPPRRWATYATAGIASAFACGHSAEGGIHYSGPINQWLGNEAGARFQLDQPGDSFRLKHSSLFFGTNGYGGAARFGITGLAGAAFGGRHNTCPSYSSIASVSYLRRGAPISTRRFLQSATGILAANTISYCGNDYVGQFDEGQLGFIGFKFNNGSGDQYGWVRVRMGKELDHTVKVIDYAYGDVGDSVRAGQTSSRKAPGLESLGGLAVGALGLLAWRKRSLRPEPSPIDGI